MLKKSKILLVACMLVLTLMLGACDDDNTPNNGAEPTADAGVIDDTIEETPDLSATADAIEAIATDDANMVATEVAQGDMNATEEAEMMMATEEAMEMEATPIVTDTAVMTDEMSAEILNVAQSNNLIGLDIDDETGTKVGEVSEVLFDESGQLQYVIVDVSEFLAESDAHITAIPWDMFQSNMHDDIIMDAEDGRFIGFYGDTTDIENATVLEEELSNDDLKLTANDLGLPVEFDNLFKLSAFDTFQVFNYNLINMNDDDLGEIESLIVDLTEGQVRYAIADVGGFLGLAETPVALPWHQIEFDDENDNFVINADEETLIDAPVPDFTDWSNGFAVNEDWDSDIEVYWENR